MKVLVNNAELNQAASINVSLCLNLKPVLSQNISKAEVKDFRLKKTLN